MFDEKIDPDNLGENPYLNVIKATLTEHNVPLELFDRFFSDFATNAAPASKGHHSNVVWGMWGHLKNVLERAFYLNTLLPSPYPATSIAKVALAHDAYKFVNAPVPNIGKRGKLLKDMWKYEPGVYLPHEAESLYIASKYFDLDDVERNALYYHHGAWSVDMEVRPYNFDVMTKLAVVLHLADMEAANLIEIIYERAGDE